MNKVLVRASLVLLTATTTFAQEPARGVPPRAQAADYAVTAHADGTVFAASLLPAKQVKKLFAFDVSSSYLVVEVACYIDPTKPRQLLREDFVLKGRVQGELSHQAEAETVAAVIQQNNLPKPPSRKPDVGVGAAVGYESGVDPVTGRKVHAVYTSTSVGVGIGNNDPGPRYPTPGGLPEDRELLQAQLTSRSLPEGKFNHPVAGYLFFPRHGVKPQTDGSYVLKYLINTNTTGQAREVSLALPDNGR